ncbi:MAG: TRAM domain-containing protein [Thermoanaerobaculia bacterium]
MPERIPPTHPGDLVEIHPEQLVAGGDALARIDGFPLFVPGLYPGDTALVEVTEVRRGFGRGVLRELRFAGPERRTNPCPVASECGGCDWTELRLDAQLRAKRSILLDSLRRVAKFSDAEIPPVRIHPSPLNYRIRSRIHAAGDGDPAIGFYAAESHRIVPLPAECEIVSPSVLRHLDELSRFGASTAGGTLEVFDSGNELVVVDPSARSTGEPVEVHVDPFSYRISTASFFQVNRHLLGTLIRLVMDLAGAISSRRSAADLYAGAGFFAVPLATLFDSVIAVEASAESNRWAEINLHGCRNAKVVSTTVEQFVRRTRLDFDFVMVDPPRAGLHQSVTSALGGMNGGTICYLSCDPVTLARDASRLRRAGWSLSSLELVDLFPNTHHIETLSSFVRVA